MRKLSLFVLLLAACSSAEKSAGPARCLDSGTVDLGAALDASPEALASDCPPVDAQLEAKPESTPSEAGRGLEAPPVESPRSLDGAAVGVDARSSDGAAVDAGKATDGAAEVLGMVDAEAAPLDSGPCGPRQILVNGTCQNCGGTGQRCCPTGDKCSSVQSICINESECFHCGDLGGTCCDGNTCAVGTCKAGLCSNG